jgi:hypothetical protein
MIDRVNEMVERLRNPYGDSGWPDMKAAADMLVELQEENARLRAKVERLEATVKAMVEWLEGKELSVFSRGLWDAVSAAQSKTSR